VFPVNPFFFGLLGKGKRKKKKNVPRHHSADDEIRHCPEKKETCHAVTS
jgi:hypothetical protein